MRRSGRKNKNKNTQRTSNVTFNTDPNVSCSHVGKSSFTTAAGFFFINPAACLGVEGVDACCLAFGDDDDDAALDPKPAAEATAAFRTSLGVGFGKGLALGCAGPDVDVDVAEGGIDVGVGVGVGVDDDEGGSGGN